MSQESVKEALLATIGAIKEKPEAGRAVFRSETKWISDVKCEANIRDFNTMTIDEPPELGGGNAGPNPVELLLAALGTCQEIMYAAYASVMGVELTSLKVDVKGYLDLQGLFLGWMRISPPATARFSTLLTSKARPMPRL